MADVTITSSGATSTYALTAPITNGSNIDFLNDNGTNNGVLLLGANAAEDAFNVTTTTINGTLYASANFGGSVVNFQPGAYGIPGDQITITHVGSLFSALDMSSNATSLNAQFVNDATNGAGIQQFYMNPDGTIDDLRGDQITFSASEIQILDGIEQAVFGTAAAADGATLDVAFVDQINPNVNPSNPNYKYADLVFTAVNAAINPCFATGTNILTAQGEMPVEKLCLGDKLITHSGEEQDIIWIGRRDINIATHPRPETVRPIIIEPDTLADGVPARRLILSPDHALYLENVLIPAKELLNWTSIRQDHSAQIITYYHLELARHDIIFAENTPAESFLDTGHRGIFDNAKTPIQTHPAEMQHRRTTQSYAPLCLTGPTLAAIRQHIASRQLGVRLG